MSINGINKEKNVTFGKNALTTIKGKGIIFLLKEKVKAGNILFVDGLNYNLLSVSHMCDQGNEIVFSQRIVWSKISI